MCATVLMTGAAGRIGTMLRARLARPGRPFACWTSRADGRDRGGGDPGVGHRPGRDDGCVPARRRGDPPGRLRGEEHWESILDVNIHGGYVAFEAARRAGVSRVIFASSNHAVGFAPRASFPVPDYAFPEPDTYYGVSKVATEALASMYHHRYGLDTICVRILTCAERPANPRALSTWLSPDDAGRLFEACLSAPQPGFRVIFGVSANTRGGWVSLNEAGSSATSRRMRRDLRCRSPGPRPADPATRLPSPRRRVHPSRPGPPFPRRWQVSGRRRGGWPRLSPTAAEGWAVHRSANSSCPVFRLRAGPG